MSKVKNDKVKILIGLAETYNTELSPLSLAMYLETLSDVDDQALQRIIVYGLKTNLWRFMPRPGEILSVIHQSDSKKLTLAAKTNFNQILTSIRKNGRTMPADLNKESQQALRLIGGINRIAEASNEELVWIEKDFSEKFELIAESNSTSERKLLIGDGISKSKEVQQLTNNIAKKLSSSLHKKNT